MTSQHRYVTVLFTDLEGYTEAASRLDNEVLYELIQQYIHLLVKEVYQYEGIVDKLTGDGLMALFGAPVAYENNAERAVRAALDMQNSIAGWSQQVREHLGVSLSMRVGLHAGPVIVGEVGSDILKEYTAIGETVNLAHRIEEAAAPGTILTSEVVFHQTRSLFEYKIVPDVKLKGIGRSPDCYRVLGLKTRSGSGQATRELRARMVGRVNELNVLQSAFFNLVDHKVSKFIMVTGETGIGKSRLVSEFKNSIRVENTKIIQGKSLTYRRTVPYWIFSELIRSSMGVAAGTSAEVTAERLRKAANANLGQKAREYLPYLETFCALHNPKPAAVASTSLLDAEGLHGQIFEAVREFLLAGAEHQPLVFILEDLHWADEASLQLLKYVLQAIPQQPFFLIGVARQVPENSIQKILAWAKQEIGAYFQQLQLHSLSSEESAQLIDLLLYHNKLPDHVLQLILSRSGGIPLYLEEVLRNMIDSGYLRGAGNQWKAVQGIEMSELGVPVSLQGVILARFDQLNEKQRRLLQCASTIGNHFNTAVLSRVFKPVLEEDMLAELAELEERGYLISPDDNPQGDYAFRHVLMSEAIYSTMLKKERSKLHALVGEAIEELYAPSVYEQVELLARHYSWSTNLPKALKYLILAGQKAAAGYVIEQARKHFEHALALLPIVEHTAVQSFQVHSGLAEVLMELGEHASARNHYQAALKAIAHTTQPALKKEQIILEEKITQVTRLVHG